MHAPEELLPQAYRLASEIAENTAPVSVALSRQMVWKMMTEAHPMAAHRIDTAAIRACGALSDAKEGVDSFLEKRSPVFTGSPYTDMPAFYPWWTEPNFGPPEQD